MKKYLLFLLFLLHSLTVQGTGIDLEQGKILTCSYKYNTCPTCTNNQWLIPYEKFSSLTDSIEVVGDKSEIIDKDNYLITGNVKLKSNSHILSADTVRISKTDKSSNASGNVKYQDKYFFFTSDKLNVRKENNDLILSAEKSQFQEISSKANGSAKKISKTPNHVILNESRYSFCPINDNTWYLKAKKIKFNVNTNRITADKATFVFFDFPIFHLPKYSWISKGRGSGFLTPSFNIYNESGEESDDWLINAPYYINIAPDKDLLISLGYLSSRGALYEGKYRQLIDPYKSQDHGLFEFEFKYLNGDYITNLNRWLVNTSVELDLSDKTHLSLHYNKASDSEFFTEVARNKNSDTRLNSHAKFTYNNPPLPRKEIKNSIEVLTESDIEKLSDSELILRVMDSGNADKIEFAGSQALDPTLPSYEKDLANRKELIKILDKTNLEKLSAAKLTKAKLSDIVDKGQIETVNYGRNIIGNNNTNQLSYAISGEDEQVVNDGVPEYEKNLETSIFSRLVSNDSKLDLSLISTDFNHKTTGKETGIRTHGEVNFNKSLGALWPIDISRLSTDTKLAISHYALDNKTNETRVIGGFDIDLSFPFSRKTTLFGSETTNRIVPIISYDYTSKQKQASIPIFDTTDEIDEYLTYSSLLSGERYLGIDRFVNENDITLGIQSIYRDRLDQKSQLKFTLAQRYYGDDEVVSDTESIDFETRSKYSDIFASAEFSINDFVTSAKLQYDPNNTSLVKNRIGFSYKPHPRKFFSLNHKDNGSDRNLTISGAYPFNNKIHIFGGIDKTLSTGKMNEETFGISYESCCWAARLAHFKTSDSVGYDYSTGFELVFNGIGSTDSYIRNKIKDRLPEYKVILE